MSYIDKALYGGQENALIIDFLKKEGFKYGTGASGEGSMYYVASNGGLYDVWIALCKDHLSLYAEYNCGGCVGETSHYFKPNDMVSFQRAYKLSVDWAKMYIQ